MEKLQYWLTIKVRAMPKNNGGRFGNTGDSGHSKIALTGPSQAALVPAFTGDVIHIGGLRETNRRMFLR
jgi:hypothetical protein